MSRLQPPTFSGPWLLFAGFVLASAASVSAQLPECDQIDQNGNVNAPGGCIAKTLQQQIGTGHGNINTPGSAIYLIKRDPARSVRRGRQLFQRKFTATEGQGPRVNSSASGDITQNRALGAGLADSCAACHGRPRGSAGFGGDVVTFPDSRDAPHLFGLGLVEMLADEVTQDLRAIRQAALDDAQSGPSPPVVLIDADFDSGTDGFAYADDTFRGTSNPAYAFGDQVQGLPGDGVARVVVGGVDGSTVNGMSGGWQRTFNVPSATSAVLTLRFNLVQQPNYESDESSEALVDLDGTEFVLGSVSGDGNGGGLIATGQTDINLNLNLSAGSHTLTLGGFNNKKTFSDEFTEIFFNNVKLVTDGNQGGPVTRQLVSKGISYGSITAFPDGTVDTSQVEGINADLRVRPFFHEGVTVSMREFIIGALNAEMGLQAWDPVLCAVTDPQNPQAMVSPAGFSYDPAQDTFERPPACSSGADPDGDGVSNEIDPALVDHLEFYLLNYFKPGQYYVSQRAEQGLQLMKDIGCTSCHVQNLTVERDRRVADVETQFDEQRGIFNQLFAQASTIFQLVPDGDPFPQVLPLEQSFVVRNIFTDLKRHDLGPAFEERDFDGSRLIEHITEPLWGVGSSPPYGHDGRSINLDAVIRRHGGEAADVTVAYAALSEDNQRKILEFLETLVLFPPDDTASSLNGGDPNSNDPQNPDNHGRIDLAQLFQIASEGPE